MLSDLTINYYVSAAVKHVNPDIGKPPRTEGNAAAGSLSRGKRNTIEGGIHYHGVCKRIASVGTRYAGNLEKPETIEEKDRN